LALLWRWLPLLITALRRRFRETVAEMRKVLWPSRKEMTTYTIVVIIFVVIMVSLVAGLDLGFAKLVLAVFG
jgi:preprotein translocase subunit SecE